MVADGGGCEAGMLLADAPDCATTWAGGGRTGAVARAGAGARENTAAARQEAKPSEVYSKEQQ